MKTVGQFLFQGRKAKGLSLEALAKVTKIRSDYLRLIEMDKFDKLPSATFVKGFISSYAKAVGLQPETCLAIFRRDFDQSHSGKIIPRGLVNPIATPSRLWSPQTTTILVSLLAVVLLLVYVASQLLNLTMAPAIELTSPNQAVVESGLVQVAGKTDPDASISVNNQKISISATGEFETTLNLATGSHTIVVRAEFLNGKNRVETRTIEVVQSLP